MLLLFKKFLHFHIKCSEVSEPFQNFVYHSLVCCASSFVRDCRASRTGMAVSSSRLCRNG